MVEARAFPCSFRVARVAFFAIPPAVLIIVLVTAVTIFFWFCLSDRLLVTGFTDYLFVSSPQWKICFSVVFEFRFNPVARTVTVFALCAISPIVNVVQ